MKQFIFVLAFLGSIASFSQSGKITVYGKPGFSGIVESEITALSTGYPHSLLLQENGNVITWIDEANSPDYAPPTNLSNVKAIASDYISAVLYEDGKVATWGHMDSRDVEIANSLENIVKISAGGFGILALSSSLLLISMLIRFIDF